MVAPAIGHPQFAMQALLRRIGITRAEVLRLGEPSAHGREAVISEAMRPADTTDKWRELRRRATCGIDDALAHVSVIAAANAEEEALAIAVALREVLEDRKKTAALVTPDRALARRVLAALERWNVAVDDSGGDALADTPAGIFARLAADAALEGLEPVTLLALLKHPLLRLGAGAGAHAHAISRARAGGAARPAPEARHGGTCPRAQDVPGQSRQALSHRSARAPDARPIARRRRSHRRVRGRAEAARSACRNQAAARGARRRATARSSTICRRSAAATVAAFAGRDGTALDRAFEEIADNAHDAVAVSASDYPDLFRAIVAETPVRRPDRPGVRVRIYGPLEARLQSIDRVVLGGLVEGVWPPETRSDPWLSRPMRRALGLDLPERRISLSAHDFAQMLGADEVILAYPAKLAGAPTVASRFVQRLAAVAGEARWEQALKRGEDYLDWARALDRPAARAAAGRGPNRSRRSPRGRHRCRSPKSRPGCATLTRSTPSTSCALAAARPGRHAARRARPRHRHSRRDRQVHGSFPDHLPNDAFGELIKLGSEHFAVLKDYPEAAAFWWPRFLRIARWFADWEARRRANVTAIAPRSAASWKSRSASARSRFARAPTASSTCATAAMRSSTTRPAGRRRRGRCRRASRRNSRSKPRSCAPGGFKDIPAGGVDRRARLRDAKRRRSRRRSAADRVRGQHARRQGGQGARELTTLVTKFEDEDIGYLSRER